MLDLSLPLPRELQLESMPQGPAELTQKPAGTPEILLGNRRIRLIFTPSA